MLHRWARCLSSPGKLLFILFSKPLAQAGPICEYLCNFVFLSLVFQYWAKVFTDVLLYCHIYDEFQDFNAKLYQMQVNAHHYVIVIFNVTCLIMMNNIR